MLITVVLANEHAVIGRDSLVVAATAIGMENTLVRLLDDLANGIELEPSIFPGVNEVALFQLVVFLETVNREHFRIRVNAAPSTRRVDAEDKRLDALLDFLLGKPVNFDEGCQIGIERRERLSTRPFVLHDS